MNLEFFCQQRKSGDFDSSEKYRCDSFANWEEFYKRTRCVGKVKYIYVVQTIRYGLIFKDDYYSYGSIYLSLGPILGKLYSLYDKSTTESWERAVQYCPTIKSLFDNRYNWNYNVRLKDHPDYTNIITADDGEKVILAKKYWFLDYENHNAGKIPVHDKSYEEKAFQELKTTAANILNELKFFDSSVIEEKPTDWVDIAIACFVGAITAYAISEISDIDVPVDVSDIDTGDFGVDFDTDASAEYDDSYSDSSDSYNVSFGHAPNDGTYTKSNLDVNIQVAGGGDKGSYDVYFHQGQKYIDFHDHWIKIQGRDRFTFNGNTYIIKNG